MIKAVICDIRDVLIFPDKGLLINQQLVDFLIEHKSNYGMLVILSNSRAHRVDV
jgi:predicted HAD superfamily phosphohydrolase YqeG